MSKRWTAWSIVLLLAATGTTACGGNNDASQNEQTHVYEEMDQEQLNQEIQKMKDEGILDENGQPAPSVDLNDYPGLG